MASKLLLKKLSSSVYYAESAVLATGKNSSGAGKGKAPELVLVLSWMDAKLRHAEKYLQTYREIYPAASLLLIRSNQRDFYSFGNRFSRSLAPAVEVIRAHSAGAHDIASRAGPASSLLVHVFSNGGCMGLRELNELLLHPSKPVASVTATQPLLAQALSDTQDIPARCIVFDSCPGHSTLRLTLRAFTAGTKNPFLKLPAMAVFSLLYGTITLWDLILRQPPGLTRLSRYLNTSLPPVSRLYLYSREDALVPFADVENHASEARKKGVGVRMERFEGTQHVAHARKESFRYWDAVKRLWEESGERVD
ncbi:hypothetical protein JCM11641_003385 [Rhodosporidiobolus odoratus]